MNKNTKPKIGGGDINEKKRDLTKIEDSEVVETTGFNPEKHRSHLQHAIEGLDRYPNYLSRWNEDDIELLESALSTMLEKVQSQKQTISKRRNGIKDMMEAYRGTRGVKIKLEQPKSWSDVAEILDEGMAEAIFSSRMFRKSKPSVEDVLSGRAKVELDVHHLQDLMDEEVFDVYSLPILNPAFCNMLASYVAEVSHFADEHDLSLNVGSRAFSLDNFGLGWINDLLLHLVLRPIVRHLYKDTELGGGDLDWRQGYVAGYSAKPSAANATPRNRLVSHTDDSEVTLNLCLGMDFDGGNLVFRGLRGDDRAGPINGEAFAPIVGTALIHAGRHLHEVTDITRGDRYAYIVWARSWSGARRKQCPCCWLNRRTDEMCICGSRWN